MYIRNCEVMPPLNEWQVFDQRRRAVEVEVPDDIKVQVDDIIPWSLAQFSGNCRVTDITWTGNRRHVFVEKI